MVVNNAVRCEDWLHALSLPSAWELDILVSENERSVDNVTLVILLLLYNTVFLMLWINLVVNVFIRYNSFISIFGFYNRQTEGGGDTGMVVVQWLFGMWQDCFDSH